MIELRDLIGKPYIVHGRGPEAYDCYGLVLEVAHRYGKSLPDAFYESTSREFNADLIDTTKPTIKAQRIDTPIEGAVVVITVGKEPNHVGVCLGDGNFIHCGKYGVRVETLASVSKRIEGFYTWP